MHCNFAQSFVSTTIMQKIVGLAGLREAAGMSVVELSTVSGVSRSTIYKAEIGEKIRANTATKLLNAISANSPVPIDRRAVTQRDVPDPLEDEGTIQNSALLSAAIEILTRLETRELDTFFDVKPEAIGMLEAVSYRVVGRYRDSMRKRESLINASVRSVGL